MASRVGWPKHNEGRPSLAGTFYSLTLTFTLRIIPFRCVRILLSLGMRLD